MMSDVPFRFTIKKNGVRASFQSERQTTTD